MKELYVSDTVLTVPSDIGYVHTKTKEKQRLTDGMRHPVKIIKVAKGYTRKKEV